MGSKISRQKRFKREMIDEFKYIQSIIAKEESLDKKIFNYSAGYGITSRTFRYEFSKEVLHMDFILTASYRMLFERLTLIKQGDVVVSSEHLVVVMNIIEYLFGQLINSLEQEEDINPILQDILTVSYTVGGNGYYLMEQGKIKFEEIKPE